MSDVQRLQEELDAKAHEIAERAAENRSRAQHRGVDCSLPKPGTFDELVMEYERLRALRNVA